MAGHLQHCARCSVSLPSRGEWAGHLVESVHQTHARADMALWTPAQRNSALVLYSSFELVTPREVEAVLEFLATQTWTGNTVTDLVLSPARPHVAVVKVETPDKLEDLFLRMGPSVRISNQLVQFKKLGGVLELEWKELLWIFQDLHALATPSLPVPEPEQASITSVGSGSKKGSTKEKKEKAPKDKGSRRTPSLLNLFIPQGKGEKEKDKNHAHSASNNNNGGSKSAEVLESSAFQSPDLLVVTSGADNGQPQSAPVTEDKSSLTRASNSRGSKLSAAEVAATSSPTLKSNASSSATTTEADAHNSTTTDNNMLTTKMFGFLRNRRDKKKDKRRKKKGDKEEEGDGDGGEDKESQKSEETPSTASAPSTTVTPAAGSSVSTAVPEIDDEGYSVVPSVVKLGWEQADKSSFYSSSDTDSEDEREKRLHVEIKPLSNGSTAPLSASVDELRSTVENLTLTTTLKGRTAHKRQLIDTDSSMKRSQSVCQQIGSSSPPPRHPYTPLSPPVPPGQATVVGVGVTSADSTSRYADLQDLFAEPPSTAIPRPPSRPRPEPSSLLGRTSTASPSPVISRTESIASLERSLGTGAAFLGGSRGPSPLTLGMADRIPLAVAFHEIVHARFQGNDETLCQVRMTGDMMLSFPAGILQLFTHNPNPSQLCFSVKTGQPLTQLVSNKELVTVKEEGAGLLSFEFNMSALTVLLRKHAEQNPAASYFNIDILKYHITPKSGATSCPLHLVAFWKCEPSQTDLRIDYKYNSHALQPPECNSASGSGTNTPTTSTSSSPAYPPLLQVCVAAPVDGGVKNMQSKPNGQWFPNTNRACWKLPALTYTPENLGVGSLRARFEVSQGPSSAGAIAAQFSCENGTLSGCEFQLTGQGYRVSLIKKRFVSGKYTCEAVDSVSRYALPPGPP